MIDLSQFKDCPWVELAKELRKLKTELSLEEWKKALKDNDLSDTHVRRLIRAYTFLENKYPVSLRTMNVKATAYAISLLPKLIAYWKRIGKDSGWIEKTIQRVIAGEIATTAFETEMKDELGLDPSTPQRLTRTSELQTLFQKSLESMDLLADMVLKKTDGKVMPDEIRLKCREVGRKLNALVDEKFRRDFQKETVIQIEGGLDAGS